jgi:CheY-like chemotaxis protein
VTVRFSISDTGVGIPRSGIRKLFIPFSQVDSSTTRKFGGTGLGLAISKQLVELMGGTISVESTEGAGSTFFIRLPLELATDSACAHSLADGNTPLVAHTPGDYRILLVEDDSLNQKVVDIMLGKLGYQTGLAKDGKAALELLTTEKFDLVLMDCSMPVLDGYLATQKIRDPATGVKNPQIPIVALTARAMHGDRERCLKVGMNDYLSKPIYCESLIKVLNNWLGKEIS